MISNCASAGALSSTNPVTGVVTRPDPLTGQQGAAPVQLNGKAPSQPAVTHAVSGISMATDTLSALLAFQQVS